MVERCKHGLIVGQCGLCANPDGPHERYYGEHNRVVITKPTKPREEIQDMTETIAPTKCLIDGCEDNATCRGLCKRHWTMWRQGKIDHPSEGPWEPAEKIQKVSTEGWIAIEIELPPEVYETIKKQALLDYRDPARQAAYYVNCMVDTSSPHGGDN